MANQQQREINRPHGVNKQQQRSSSGSGGNISGGFRENSSNNSYEEQSPPMPPIVMDALVLAGTLERPPKGYVEFEHEEEFGVCEQA